MSTNLPSLDRALRHWAMTTPDAPFVTEVESEVTLSYGSLWRAVRSVRGLLGSSPRTVVMSLPGGICASAVWLATLGGGHRLVLCSPDATIDERSKLAIRYRPSLVVAENFDAASGFGLSPESIFTREQFDNLLEDWLADSSGVGAEGVEEPVLEGLLCLTTSGTTGEPKGVTLTAGQVAWTADQIRISHCLTAGDRGFTCLPFFHINAPVVSLSATLLAGASVVIAPRFSISRFWGWLEREQVTWASAVPTIISHLLQTERPAWLPGRLRYIRTASAPLPAARLVAFEEKFGIPLVETYGLSEAASQVFANPVPPGVHKPGSVGLSTGVRARICQVAEPGRPADLRDVGPGEDGEICISGPNVIPGYDEDRSPESFVGGWFRTGDLGRRDEDGYLFITGRLRDVINRGGEKVAPREVEELLMTHPDVADVVVLGEPDPVYGQMVVAHVVPSGERPAGFEEELRSYASERLARYKVPSRFVLVESLPRSGTGKIKRHLIVGGVPGTSPVKAEQVPS